MSQGFSNGRMRELDPKQRASAREILDAAAQAFSERGYAATSIDDIADVLGCTKGRIYHYFRTKGDLFIGIHHQALEWGIEAIGPVAERTDVGPAEKLREMVHAHVMHLMNRFSYMGPAQFHGDMELASEGRKKDQAIARLLELRRQFEGYYVSVVKEGVAAGAFRDVDVTLVVRAVIGTVNWLYVWFRPDDPHDSPRERERIATEFAEYALHGVLA